MESSQKKLEKISKVFNGSGLAETKIVAALEAIIEINPKVSAELYLFDNEKKMAFLVSAHPKNEKLERVVSQDQRPEIFNCLTKQQLIKDNNFLALPLVEQGKTLGSLAINLPKKCDQQSLSQLAEISIVLSLLLVLPLKQTKIYNVVNFVIDNYQRMPDEEKQELLKLLAGSFSHVLNQPLTSILGYLELLAKGGKLKGQELEYLKKIEEESNRLNGLLRKLESLDLRSVEEYVGSSKIIMPLAEDIQESEQRLWPGLQPTSDIGLFIELANLFSEIKNKEQLLKSFSRVVGKRFKIKQLCYFVAGEQDRSLQQVFSSRSAKISAKTTTMMQQIYDLANRELGIFYDTTAVEDFSTIFIPLSMQRMPLGILLVSFRDKLNNGRLIQADEKLLLSLAGQLSLSLLDLRLFSEAEYWRGYLEELIESANALIFALDGQGKISVYNRAMEYLFGYSKKELIGKEINLLFQQESTLARFNEIQQRAISGGEVHNCELNLQSKDGQVLPVTFNFTAIHHPARDETGLVAIGQDLSEVRSLEQQIIQSEKLAYFGRMSAAFVHELNNPLTSISVYSDYLLRRAETSGLAKDEIEKLEKISNSAERIQKFTQDLTSFARPADRENIEQLLITDVLNEAMEFTEHQTRKLGITIKLETAKRLPKIWAVRSQLQQVFVNLIVNASQAAQEGGKIDISASDHDPQYILVKVEDNGIGVEPMFLSRIFDPFFSTKSRSEGTGLGLSIVKRIIDNHLGSIRVNSVRDQGTCFSVFLPKEALKEKLTGGRRRG